MVELDLVTGVARWDATWAMAALVISSVASPPAAVLKLRVLGLAVPPNEALGRSG